MEITINDITAAILNGEMTTEDAVNMFKKQLNAAMEKEAKKVREENINKSAVKVIKAAFDFIVTSYPELIPKDFALTDEMINEAVNDIKAFTKEIIDTYKKENNIEMSTDIDYGTISLRKRGKSIIKIGNERLGGIDVEIEVSTKFNWLQKKIWKYLLNVDIEDIEEDE